MDFKLIIKKIKQTLSKEDEKIFKTWYNESQRHRDYFKKVQRNYNRGIDTVNLEKGWYKISKRTDTQKSVLNLKYAAAVAMFISFGSLWYFNSFKDKSKIHQEYEVAKDNTIKIGTDKATLTLDDGSKIALEKGMVYNNNEASSNGEQLVYKSAKSISSNLVRQNTLTIPRGGQFYLVLADGTKVWMNSETKLKYPIDFTPNKTREVELVYGEAYFEVSPSTKHNGSGFIVHSEGQDVQVLGTQFNIKAYKDENTIFTTLVEGKVLVENLDNQYQKLIPGEQSSLSLDSKSLNVTQVDVYNQISWKDGLFSFKNTSLKEITKVLSRWYDVSIVFEDQTKETIEFNGVFRKNSNLKQILDIIQNTNEVKYRITNKTITMI
ncbi:FecR family protein [Seonamhaeicola sediminis]|uniref:FecR family protein n=1 Tax=Seonamhaeicola sediminis TaxID=2528206 RepID=A0A562YHN7_9FLAO|nr:FecR family protein [Seonamhaeicola sediminis]TWO34535.1 FecR family protein [Seonamhaeicola sediminis]